MSPCSQTPNRATYVVNVTSKVQEDRVGQFGPIDEIVLPKAVAVQDSGIDVNDHVSVVSPRLEHIRAVGEEVIEGRNHLYFRGCQRLAGKAALVYYTDPRSS